MVSLTERSYLSEAPEAFIDITEDIREAVAASGVGAGVAYVICTHTTCGIVVNEGLPCVERDLRTMLDGLAPLEGDYAHAHFLPSYGATGNNSPGHLKSTLVGNHCVIPVMGGEALLGGAQTVWLAEFDGPQRRRVWFEVLGDPA